MKINTDLLHAHQLHARLTGTYQPAAKAHISPIYQTTTYVLEDFDSHCIILDPAKPTFEHNYRRIFLENQCSMYYTVNIEKPRSIGDWKFLGPPSEVDHFDQLISKNMNQW